MSVPVCHPTPDTTGGAVVAPSLWGAALAGLLGIGAVSCATEATDDTDDTDDTEASDDTDDTDDTEASDDTPEGPTVTSSTQRPELTFSVMSEECIAAGGVMQIHATCAGNNACAGMSFNKWSKQFTEHTCKGMNSCGGASCVVLPADEGRDAAEIYDELCGSMCHGDGFNVYVAPSGDAEAALTTFAERSVETHVRVIAFGMTGVSPGGTYYANMPGFHEKLSRAEIERVIAHVRTLEVSTSTYGIPGETEDFTDAE